MKIGEAKELYSNQLNRLREQRKELLEKKKQAESSGNDELISSVNAALGKAEKQYKTASEFMEGFSVYTAGLYNKEASKKQSDAMAKQADETRKCLEVARRISNGDTVPYEDEMKLMNYNREVYMMAKNMAALKMNEKKHKDHESLWDEEDDTPRKEMSAEQIVDGMDCALEMPASAMEDIPMDFE